MTHVIDIPRMVAFMRSLGITLDTPRFEERSGVRIPCGDRQEVWIPRSDWRAVEEAMR